MGELRLHFSEWVSKAHGITVVSGKCGDAGVILDAYVAGRLDEPAYAMPGCRGVTTLLPRSAVERASTPATKTDRERLALSDERRSPAKEVNG